MKRRLCLFVLALVVAVTALFYRPHPSVELPARLVWSQNDQGLETMAEPVWVGAKGAALMDVDSFRLLSGKNIHQRLPMASTTKIMTAILAIESGRLEETVTVSQTACQVEPSSIWLVVGEQIKLEHLVYGLMLRSGNDAALAIAEFIGGSVSGFAQLMNRKAADLGLLDTNFVNPHGLPHPEHFTSAFDLAKLAAYSLQNPKFAEVVSTKTITIPWPGHSEPRVWVNKNQLLTTYDGASGVKTGWTKAAGHCLVASAKRDGLRVVAVVLNSPDDFGETSRLMDYAFANYHTEQLVGRGEWLQSLAVVKGEPDSVGVVTAGEFVWPVAAGERVNWMTELVLPTELQPPVTVGQRVGSLRVLIDGQCLAEIPLAADRSADKGFWDRLLHQLGEKFWRMVGNASGGDRQ